MALQDFPVLPESYPLFDWSDWQASHAALIPGGLTKKFEKACWNDLVDTVAEAIEAAGMQWWDGEHFPEDIKMLSDGSVRLTAAHFNHLRSAIDGILELPWRWDYDETYRGYIGRLNFYGSSGKTQDILYPEYLLELASHINMVLGIMRGTAQTEVQDARNNSELRVLFASEQAPASVVMPKKIPAKTSATSDSSIVLLGDLIDFPDHVSRSHTKGPQWQNGTVIYKNFKGRTSFDLRGTVRPSNPVNVPVYLATKRRVEADFIRLAAMEAEKKSAANLQAALSFIVLVAAAKAIMEHRTSFVVPLWSAPPRKVEAQGKTGIRSEIGINLKRAVTERIDVFSGACVNNPQMDLWDYRKVLELVPIMFSVPCLQEVLAVKAKALVQDVQMKPRTVFAPEVVQKISVNTEADYVSKTTADTGLNTDKAAVIQKQHKSRISRTLTLPKHQGAPVFTEVASGMAVSCAMDALSWTYPEWVDGGLLIRQAYETVQRETGELEIR